MKAIAGFLVVIVLAVGGAAWWVVSGHGRIPPDLLAGMPWTVAPDPLAGGGVQGPVVSTPPLPVARTVNVLFVGNSYTFVNDLPGMVGKIASSDPANDTRYRIHSVTSGGATLDDMWKRGEGRRLLESLHPAWLVLQENSLWPMYPAMRGAAAAAVAGWAGAGRAAGSRPVLFETWPRKPRSHWYLDTETGPVLKSADNMAAAIHRETVSLSAADGVSTVMVGDVWARVLRERPGLELYNPDGTHPGPAGTYLAALLFYRVFSGHAPDATTFVPPGVAEADAAFLRAAASR